MGALRHSETGRRAALSARTLVGRAASCDLVLEGRKVSGEHARLHWAEGAWWLRDLGSRNGSFVGGARLEPGATRRLALGETLVFGSRAQSWVLDDDAPPVAVARPLSGGDPREAEDGLLALPTPEAPEAQVMALPSGRWQLELGEEVREVQDLETVFVAGQGWQLFLPAAYQGTVEDTQAEAEALTLRFAVSLDEEHVALEALAGARALDLGQRAHNYLLLTLARRRLEDAALPEAEQGWVYREALLSGLRLTPPRMNLQIFRARQAFAKALSGAGRAPEVELIERRLDTGQLRLGVSRLEVRRA